VTLANFEEINFPNWVTDAYIIIFVAKIVTFQGLHPFWTSLGNIVLISLFNAVVTDGPMIYLMVAYSLYDKNTACAIAMFVNICVVCFSFLIWPMKWYIKNSVLADDNPRSSMSRTNSNEEPLSPDSSSTVSAVPVDDQDEYQWKPKVVPFMALIATVIALGVLIIGAVFGLWVAVEQGDSSS
jgi:hypothetical protein